MNDNTIESIEWHKDQLSKLLSDEIGFYKVESELDSILEKAKMKKKVKVTRGGKTFYREQEVGRKEEAGKKEVKKVVDKLEIELKQIKGKIDAAKAKDDKSEVDRLSDKYNKLDKHITGLILGTTQRDIGWVWP